MRGRHHAKPDMTAASAKIALNSLLYGCTDAALERLTVREIVACYRGVTEREAEYRLTIQRQKRANRVIAS